MRLSSDSLDPKVAVKLLNYLVDDNTVLVGGQSVMLWAYHYDLAGPETSYTKDIDFFGNSADIEAAQRRLVTVDHETRFADLEDSSPNSGLILISLEGCPKIRVDYLWAVQGLSGSDIQERSVPLKIKGVSTPVRVLHPLMCLESKVINLGAFPLKRDEDGVAQAKVAVQIVNAYIQNLIANERNRDALNATERVFRIAQMDASSFSWHLFGVDLMKAVPTDGLPQAFLETRLQQMRERIEVVRQALGRRLPEKPTRQSTHAMRF